MYGPPEFKRMIQFIWDPEPQNLDHDHEIVCLGKRYSPVNSHQAPTSPEPPGVPICSEGTDTTDAPPGGNDDVATSTSINLSSSPTEAPLPKEWPADFLDDAGSRIWLTYRTSFPIIPKSRNGPSPVSIGGIFRGSGIDLNGFTSDVGWGCMIRTSQSLLANCLLMLQLGRDWRRPRDPETLDPQEVHLISLFADDAASPFSIHNFVKHGEAACGKRPGEWFGPSAAASSIKALTSQLSATKSRDSQGSAQPALVTTQPSTSTTSESYESNLRVFISSGSDLYEKPFLRTAVDSKTGVFHPTLILLGLRLGIDKVNQVYWDSLKAILASPQAVGIAGGRPSSSHYFYGYQGDNLFYLDPHFPKPALSPAKLNSEAIDTTHSKRIRVLHLSEMDPSMLVGILIKDADDWKNWKDSVETASEQAIIHISPQPVDLRRQSVSVSNDEDCEFIDVMLEPDEDGAEGDSEVVVESDSIESQSTADESSKEYEHEANDKDTSGEFLESGDGDEPVIVVQQPSEILEAESSSVLVDTSTINSAGPVQKEHVKVQHDLDKEKDSDYEYCPREEEPVVVVMRDGTSASTVPAPVDIPKAPQAASATTDDDSFLEEPPLEDGASNNSFHDVETEEGFQKLTVLSGDKKSDHNGIGDTQSTTVAAIPIRSSGFSELGSALSSTPRGGDSDLSDLSEVVDLAPSSHSSGEHVEVPASFRAMSGLSSTSFTAAANASSGSSSLFNDEGYHKVFAPSSITSTFSMSAYIVERPSSGKEELDDDQGLVDVSNRSVLQRPPPATADGAASLDKSLSGTGQNPATQSTSAGQGFDDWGYT